MGERETVPANCPERKRLLLEFRDSVDQYAQAVHLFVDKVQVALGGDRDLLLRNCRNALDQAERARLALLRDEANHYCDRTDFNKKMAVDY